MLTMMDFEAARAAILAGDPGCCLSSPAGQATLSFARALHDAFGAQGIRMAFQLLKSRTACAVPKGPNGQGLDIVPPAPVPQLNQRAGVK